MRRDGFQPVAAQFDMRELYSEIADVMAIALRNMYAHSDELVYCYGFLDCFHNQTAALDPFLGLLSPSFRELVYLRLCFV